MTTPFNFVNLGIFSIAASSGTPLDLDIYLSEAVSTSLSVLFRVTPSATLGIKVELFSGFGGVDPIATVVGGLKVVPGGSSVPIYSGKSLSFSNALSSTLVPVPSAGAQNFSLDILDTLNAANAPGEGNWLKLRITNLDNVAESVQVECAYR